MDKLEESEDCLYLNIITGAQSSDEKRPVYIWCHGGGFNHGYYHEIEFDGSELANKGIVVVTFAHRLNIFGYLALPPIAAEQGGVSGDYGLMDSFVMLDWVCDNIAAFGGDLENISIGGQSAGNRKATMLAASPMSRGRIKKLIQESDLNWIGKIQPYANAEKCGL